MMPTPTALPPGIFDSSVSYTDFALTAIMLCIDAMVIIAFVSWLIVRTGNKRRAS